MSPLTLPWDAATIRRTPVNARFGPNTGRVLEFIAELPELSPEQMNLVTSAWKQASSRARGEAWARLVRGTTRQERYPILAAASLARQVAIDAASRLDRPDWAFWAAAHEAAAAIAASDRIGCHFHTLTGPFATVMPSLARCLGQGRQDPA